ncbi:acyl carrier protein [Alkalihalobacillus xiaoxiensis]|uniref:Acyl carrier protein n=1 Tax=Shouchella xiaoxiensis TaxID=766895 RepID=A0ABS2T2M4_9BACI|nr:phosphopantetheine-binding protein [Shouchella xiaoxiensis]MBM7840717.1 acyl carrier protein [Shouchella xiaoxiensis]
MTYEQAVETIHFIMKTELDLHTLDSFHEFARLNEDLAVDSVMILQILLELEMEYGIDIPDEKLERSIFHSVESLARFIEAQEELKPTYD